MRIILAILLLCTSTCSFVSFAEENKALAVTPPGGFQFSGAWECEGAFRSGKVHRATFTGATVLADKWIELNEQDVEPATGYLAKYLIGYDPQQKRLVEFDANNFGAAVYSSEQGWQEQVLTMTSAISEDAKAPYAVNRFLYSVKSADEFTIDWQVSKTSTLNWIPADHLACKRRIHT